MPRNESQFSTDQKQILVHLLNSPGTRDNPREVLDRLNEVYQLTLIWDLPGVVDVLKAIRSDIRFVAIPMDRLPKSAEQMWALIPGRGLQQFPFGLLVVESEPNMRRILNRLHISETQNMENLIKTGIVHVVVDNNDLTKRINAPLN